MVLAIRKPRQIIALERIRGYDEATGQVYEETQVPVTSMVSTWPTKCNGKKQEPQDYRHRGRGSSSLLDMALRSCAWHFDWFQPSDLQAAEWPYAKKIYQHLQKNQNLTANAWSTFQHAFPDEEELNHTYPIRIPALHGDLAAELPSIQQWLQVLPFSHLSLLNIQGLRIQLTDLIMLTSLTNLGVLLIRHPHGNSHQDLCDKYMRDWSRAVQEKSAFTKLRVVGFHCFYPSLQATLNCLATFPALQICTVEPYLPTPSAQFAVSQIARVGLPFELFPEATKGVDDDPESIWSRGNVSGHTKMKLLYDLAGKLQLTPTLPCLHPPQADPKDSAVLSVYYGAERRFAYSAYPLWFKRVATQPAKRQETSQLPARNDGAGKKRKIRPGKQSDIGSILGTFG